GVGAVERYAEVRLVNTRESLGGDPVAARAGNLFGIQFGRYACGVEMCTPVCRHVEWEGEVDGLWRANIVLQEPGREVDHRRVAVQRYALLQPMNALRVTFDH